MPIWSAEIKELEKLYQSLKSQFPDLAKEFVRLIKAEDENMILLYSRRCLEVIITDLCERELNRPRKAEPLKGIIDKLQHDEKIPPHIITSMQSLNSMSTYGAHPKDFDPEQIKPVLVNLDIIIKWYLKYNDSKIYITGEAKDAITNNKAPEDSSEKIQKPKKRLILLLSGGLSVTIIVLALFVFNIIEDRRQIRELEKSIAVLPFRNESIDEENAGFVNGLMEKTLNNLQLIKDFRVISRTSVEQYRNQNKSITEIAKELGVNYIVEGSGQKYGNTFSLSVQLIKAVRKEDHLWGKSFEQKIEGVDDILKIQSEIAEAIAKELEANITSDEKQLIDKVPTRNLTAFDFYQRGKEEYTNYTLNNSNKGALDRARNLYLKALDYDSTFAQAYIGLATVYWAKHYSSEFFTDSFMDSLIVIIDKALSYDSKLSEAYTLRGAYYFAIGNPEQAIQELDKALKFNPNDWEAYWEKGNLYMVFAEEMDKAILNLYQAYSIYRGPRLPDILNSILTSYQWAGFMDQANLFNKKIVELTSDSAAYFLNLGKMEKYRGNYEKARNYLEKSYAFDSTRENTLDNLVEIYTTMNIDKISLSVINKYAKLLETSGSNNIMSMHRIGYGYWLNGYKNESEFYMNEEIKYCFESIRLNRFNVTTKYVYYDIAAVYAFKGESEKALENLQIFNQRSRMPLWVVTLINNDPLFNNIRNEPEFQQIVRDVENKYQTEHERVGKWLEEHGLL